jgi:hypothetical protein
MIGESCDWTGKIPMAIALLPGETPMSVNPEEVVHWIAVYSDLAEFLRSEAQPSAPSLAERYQRRVAYWVRRLEELTG